MYKLPRIFEIGKLCNKIIDLCVIVFISTAAAVQRTPNTVTNSKRALRQVSSAHQLARHFRRTPKGFLHSPKKRKIAASTSSIIIRRKSRTDPKENLKQAEMTPKEKDLKDLVTSRVSFEQLLDDESFWDT